jgi:hypothetical protein
MDNRFIRYFGIPMVVATVLSIIWGVGMLYLWRAVGKSAEMLAAGTPANRVASRMARVDEAMAPVILYSIAALIVPLLIWFLVCWRLPIGNGEARKMRGLWFTLFLVAFAVAAAMVYWQGFRLGSLSSYMSRSAMIVQGAIGFAALLLGYWIISIISTNRLYRPATLPF